MSIRTDLDRILSGINQENLTEDEFSTVTLTGSPSRFELYQALIPILEDRPNPQDSLPRLKSYAHATDNILINVNTSALESAQASSNVFLGAPLEN